MVSALRRVRRNEIVSRPRENVLAAIAERIGYSYGTPRMPYVLYKVRPSPYTVQASSVQVGVGHEQIKSLSLCRKLELRLTNLEKES